MSSPTHARRVRGCWIARHYKLHPDDRMRTITDPPDEPTLEQIYSDRALLHSRADGSSLPSTNSQPSLVIDLVDRLGLAPVADDGKVVFLRTQE